MEEVAEVAGACEPRLELPHFELYLRRLRRLSARGTIALTIFWLAAVLSAALWQELVGWGLLDQHGLIPLALIFGGKFAIYWIIADAMGGLARERRGHSPQWYTSLLADRDALLGTLAAAMLAAVPALIGMLTFMPIAAGVLDQANTADWVPWVWGGELRSFYYIALFSVLKLPLYALACAAIQLALRRLAIAGLLPVLLAFSAVCTGLWDPSMFAGPQPLALPGTSSDCRQALCLLLLLGLALFALLLMQLKLHSESELPQLSHGLLAGVILGVPLVAAVLTGMTVLEHFQSQNRWAPQYVDMYSYPPNAAYFEPAIGAHFVATAIAPDAQLLWVNMVANRDYSYYRYHRAGGPTIRTSSYGSSGVRGWMLYGVPVGPAAPWLQLLYYAVSGCGWYWIALRCLNAARHPAWFVSKPRS